MSVADPASYNGYGYSYWREIMGVWIVTRIVKHVLGNRL